MTCGTHIHEVNSTASGQVIFGELCHDPDLSFEVTITRLLIGSKDKFNIMEAFMSFLLGVAKQAKTDEECCCLKRALSHGVEAARLLSKPQRLRS